MTKKFKLPSSVVKFVNGGKKIYGGQFFTPEEVGLTEEEIMKWPNVEWECGPIAVRKKETKKEKEIDLDLNDDGKFDEKDKSIAGRVLRKVLPKRRKKRKKKGE